MKFPPRQPSPALFNVLHVSNRVSGACSSLASRPFDWPAAYEPDQPRAWPRLDDRPSTWRTAQSESAAQNMSPLLAARYPPRFPGFIFVGVQRASDRLPRHPSPFDYPVVCISDQPRARPGFDNRAGFQRDWDVKTEAEHTTRGSEDLARSANIPAPLPNHPELFASTYYTHLISLVAHFLSYTKPLDRDHGSDLTIEEAYRRNPIRKVSTLTGLFVHRETTGGPIA
ncbi:unnamed protein product [Rhizoctonia solani]|uniref:Uncharacterized protein n=1 Tax=Rhizoctonia solani TaxID=456999 RepID=A0A8H3DT51_9AGAM|nr:unnamed protein product [Rhizoctonia solani]